MPTRSIPIQLPKLLGKAMVLYLVEVVQRNRIVKIVRRTPDYDAALVAFQSAKASPVREARFFKQDEDSGKVLLKYVDKSPARSPARR